jgi:hypothetical protein
LHRILGIRCTLRKNLSSIDIEHHLEVYLRYIAVWANMAEIHQKCKKLLFLAQKKLLFFTFFQDEIVRWTLVPPETGNTVIHFEL